MHRKLNVRKFLPVACLFAGLSAGAVLSDAMRPAAANAESALVGFPPPKDDEPLSPFNSGEQRRLMIVQLTEMNQRLTRIETKLNSGLSVKVTEMPAVTVKEKSDK